MTDPDTDPTTEAIDSGPTFADLGLNPAVLRALDDVGYEVPTPIQAATIPPLLEGRDVLGQAQTGTGKTAAFALPLLSRIRVEERHVQALILAPTRELALQVAEAVQKYSAHLKGLSVLPIYGGTPFDGQLRALRRGVHVVVGTPGRVMDHMRRGTLKLDKLDTLVLDEADEMLRMGFIDDVTWILEQAPPQRRIALFSATMPPVIRRIAADHLTNPIEIRIEQKTRTADTVRQRYRVVPHHHKVDVLTRVLESEPYDGMLVFVRTRHGCVELADKLEARGVTSAALNGDVPQRRRETIVENLKRGKIDVLVATDVAARGLDVERLTHVVNYDPPHDTEAYVHRIGRTGRAGRQGEAILFVTPRERHIVQSIERSTRQKLEKLLLPTTDEVNERRLENFKVQVERAIGTRDTEPYREIVRELVEEGHDPVDVAAALALVGQGDEPLLLDTPPKWEREAIEWRNKERTRGDRPDRRSDGPPMGGQRSHDSRPRRGDEPMDKFRIEVGHDDGVRPGNIVGAIAGESGLEGRFIGHIDIRPDHTMLELPAGMPDAILQRLQRVWVCGKQLQMTPASGARAGRPKPAAPRRAPSAGPPPRAAASAGAPRAAREVKPGSYTKRPGADAAPPKKRGSKKANPNKGKKKAAKKDS